MRTVATLGFFPALLVCCATAHAEDCTQLQGEAAQIACLQRGLAALREELDELRALQAANGMSVHPSVEQFVEARIGRAMARVEDRLKEEREPRVHLLEKAK